MYQQITLVGRLGNDPEMRFTQSGVPVTSFSLATSRSWVDDSGERNEKTTWFRVTFWRRQAEVVAEYFKKGNPIMVVGEMEEAKPWTDRDGNTRASLEVTGRSFTFIASRAESNGSSGYGDAPQSGPQQEESTINEEDIPF